jgi:hypothetical protein
MRRSDNGLPDPESAGELLRTIGSMIETDARTLKASRREARDLPSPLLVTLAMNVCRKSQNGASIANPSAANPSALR